MYAPVMLYLAPVKKNLVEISRRHGTRDCAMVPSLICKSASYYCQVTVKITKYTRGICMRRDRECRGPRNLLVAIRGILQ